VSPLFDLPFEEPEPEATTAPAGPVRRVLTVSELTGALRELLETTFPEIWVEGELSNAKVWTTGHLYFTLKDGSAQIKGVMFRSALRYLKFKPEDGLHVVVRGRISVYDPKGEYQIVAEHLEPHGFGPLQLAFEQLKKKLAAEGLFEAARKRALPSLPRRIGVVTSIDGAALRDIIRVLRRRYPNAHVVIAPCRVQGDNAAGEIVRALRQIGRIDGVDVVIVARGGGSLEDLWAFNEEKVARAIAASPVPIISGVGHETDFTIADFVADVRAATPSAAAELVVRRKDEFCSNIDRLGNRLDGAVHGRIRRLESRLNALVARPGYAGFQGRVAMRGRHAAELTASLRQAVTSSLGRSARRHQLLIRALDQFDPRHRLAAIRMRLVERDGALAKALTRRLHGADSRFKSVAGRLEGLSPLAVLGRGYAVAWDASRTRILRDAGSLTVGDRIRVTLEHGELGCEVVDPPASPAPDGHRAASGEPDDTETSKR
jgi:exodeoxyribonuclease VII large subunit